MRFISFTSELSFYTFLWWVAQVKRCTVDISGSASEYFVFSLHWSCPNIICVHKEKVKANGNLLTHNVCKIVIKKIIHPPYFKFEKIHFILLFHS